MVDTHKHIYSIVGTEGTCKCGATKHFLDFKEWSIMLRKRNRAEWINLMAGIVIRGVADE